MLKKPSLFALKIIMSWLLFSFKTFATTLGGQVVQINTDFSQVLGQPEWVLIIRNIETGEILPYLFEIRENKNFWLAFTSGNNYKIIASTLSFGPYANLENFCRLEKGIIEGKSMRLIISGILSPDRNKIRCKLNVYSNANFTIVNDNAK